MIRKVKTGLISGQTRSVCPEIMLKQKNIPPDSDSTQLKQTVGGEAAYSYGNAGGTVGKSLVNKGGCCRPAFIASKGRNPTSSDGEAGCS